MRKARAKTIQQSLNTGPFLGATRVVLLMESEEQHSCNAYTVRSSRLREGNEYVQAELELLPMLCGVEHGLRQAQGILSHQESMETMCRDRGNLCGTTLTRESDFRNSLLLWGILL